MAYLRAETCQPIFNDFKRVREAARQKIPFGIAQIGKAFRNEINPRNFTFRSREFEQAELEFFVHPSEREKWFEHWRAERVAFHRELGFAERAPAHAPARADELAHYAKRRRRRRVPVPVRLAGDRGRPRPRRLGPVAPHASSRARTSAVTDRGDQGALHADGDRDVGGRRPHCLALLCNAYAEEKLADGETRVVLRFPAAAGADQGGGAAALEEARRARARASRASCAGAGTSSTTRPATSAGATAARTRSGRRSVSPRLRVGDRRQVTVRERDSMGQDRIAARTRARGLPAGSASSLERASGAKQRQARASGKPQRRARSADRARLLLRRRPRRRPRRA